MADNTQHLSTFEVDGHVARITLNRPEAMNSLNPELRWELSQHYDEVERNDDIWLAVVTGAGERAFCAGADLKHRLVLCDPYTTPDIKRGRINAIGWGDGHIPSV